MRGGDGIGVVGTFGSGGHDLGPLNAAMFPVRPRGLVGDAMSPHPQWDDGEDEVRWQMCTSRCGR